MTTSTPTHGDILAAAQRLPETRDLAVIVAALTIAESEFSFQAYRLREHVEAKTAEQARHYEGMRHAYEAAHKTAKRLRKYLANRQRALAAGEAPPSALHDSRAIDAAGRATAYADDEGAPV